MNFKRIILIISCMVSLQAADTLQIAFTGNNRGLLVPCGCSVPTGGLARQVTFFDVSKPDMILNAGNTFFPDISGQRANHKLNGDKARLAARIFSRINYSAINIGEFDLTYGAGFLTSLCRDHRLSLIGCNVIDMQDHLLGSPYKIFSLKGYNIAVTGFCRIHQGQDYRVLDPVSSLKAVIKELSEKKTDMIICLADEDIQKIPDLSAQLEDIDLFICSRRPGANSVPMSHGDASFVQLGSLGRNAGLLSCVINAPSGTWQDLSSFRHRAEFARARLKDYDRQQQENSLSLSPDQLRSNVKKYLTSVNRYSELSARTERFFTWDYTPLDHSIPDDPPTMEQVIKLEKYPE